MIGALLQENHKHLVLAEDSIQNDDHYTPNYTLVGDKHTQQSVRFVVVEALVFLDTLVLADMRVEMEASVDWLICSDRTQIF